MNYIIYTCFALGLIPGGIWIAQKVSTLNILDVPATGAGIFFMSAFLLNFLAQKKLRTKRST